MFEWIGKNIGTLLVLAVLALGVFGVIMSMIKQKRQGKSSCGCSCAGCAMNGSCHSAKENAGKV